MTDPGVTGQPAYREIIDLILGQLPDKLKRAAGLAAVPHRFDSELFGRLIGEEAQAERQLAELRRFGLVQETAPGWLAFQEAFRAVLRGEVEKQIEAYRAASRCAWDYFRARLEQAQFANPEQDLLESLYHHLAADEPAGIEELRRYFESFRRGHQAELTSQLLAYAREQQVVLSPNGCEWLDYLEARQVQIGPQPELSLNLFSPLASTAKSALLRALARRGIGETLAHLRQCRAALDELTTALEEFERIGDPLEIANTQAGLGMLFVTLAESAGGLHEEMPALESRLERWVYRVQHAPFLIYRWFSRRFGWVPNLYYGTDYQNWIITRYLYSALDWFERAERSLRQAGSREGVEFSGALVQIKIRIADLHQLTGRWSQAARLYQALALAPPVQGDRYLHALVQLGQASLMLAKGARPAAITTLEACLEIFQHYGDGISIGKTARLLGQAHLRMGAVEAALEQYRQATAAFYQANDLVNATEARLQALNLSEKLFPRDTTHAQAELPPAPRMAFMERFPDRDTGFLHRLFRGIAAYGVLPLTYLLVIGLAYFQVLWTVGGEILVRAVGTPSTALKLLADLSAALPFLGLMPILGLWIYEGLYAAAGALVARWLPYAWITRLQAMYFILDEQALSCYDAYGHLVDCVPWAQVRWSASLNRRIWREPLTLFSSFLIGTEDKAMRVNGIANRYPLFEREVKQRVPEGIRRERLDFTLFERRRGIWILGIAALLTGLALLAKWIVPNQGFIYLMTRSRVAVTLYATEVAFWFWKWLLLCGPLLTLASLLRNRHQIRQRLGKWVQVAPDWPIWVAIIFLALLLVGELVNLFIF